MTISDFPEAVKAIDLIINRKGTAEIKLEGKDELKLVVVETSRQVKNMTPVKD